jgi:S1-C subfamily serine protease
MRNLVLASVLVVAGSTPLAAGECSYPAQECLDHLARMRDRGYAGVDLDAEDPAGWTVTKVNADTPAAAAGIRIGDVLLAIGDIRMGDEEGMQRLGEIMKPGNSVTFTILRGGTERRLELELVRMPDDVFARFVGEHMLKHTTEAAGAAEAP